MEKLHSGSEQEKKEQASARDLPAHLDEGRTHLDTHNLDFNWQPSSAEFRPTWTISAGAQAEVTCESSIGFADRRSNGRQVDFVKDRSFSSLWPRQILELRDLQISPTKAPEGALLDKEEDTNLLERSPANR